MKKEKHALLSASSSSRWLKCTPAPRIEEKLPEVTSAYAEEGRYAHEYAELHLRNYVNEITKKTFNAKLKKLKENQYFTLELHAYLDSYIQEVRDRIKFALEKSITPPVILFEREVDYSHWVPGGFGTADVILVHSNTIEIIDLKYGAGVPVSAENNSQMRLYALGALSEFGCIFDINNISNTIYQPRLGVGSHEWIKTSELLQWGESIKPVARQAWAGEGEFVPDNHCQFCRAKSTCKARAEKNLELAKYEFRQADLLTDEEINIILDFVDEMIAWGKDIQDYAYKRALTGQHWDGWKLVEGRSNRRYSDPIAVAEALKQAGLPEDDIYKKEVLGIGALETKLGKAKFAEILSGLVFKPPGKPALVRESDGRPEFNSAEEDFKNEYIEFNGRD